MSILQNIEFFRNSFILVPELKEKYLETVLIAPQPTDKTDKIRLFCSCSRGKAPKCDHAKAITEAYRFYVEKNDNMDIIQRFEQSIFLKIFAPLAQSNPISVQSVELVAAELVSSPHVYLTVARKRQIIYFSTGTDRQRFLSRINKMTEKNAFQTRFTLMQQVRRFVLTETEKQMVHAGHKTIRLASEESLWYRLAYHCYREFDINDITFTTHIDAATGDFMVAIETKSAQKLLTAFIAPDAVLGMVHRLNSASVPAKDMIQIGAEEKEIFFRIEKKSNAHHAAIVPLIQHELPNGEKAYYELEAKFVYGTSAYFPALNKIVSFSAASVKILAQKWYARRTVKQDELSRFIQRHQQIFTLETSSGNHDSNQQLDLFAQSKTANLNRIVAMDYITEFDTVAIKPLVFGAPWCTVAVTYQKGTTEVSIVDVLKVRQRKERFLITDTAIIDCNSEQIARLNIGSGTITKKGTVTLHRAAVFHLCNSHETALKPIEKGRHAAALHQLLNVSPRKPLESLHSSDVNFRSYQTNGIQWLLFLYDNQLGGLLCDDMGLGKTHQVLGFFLALQQQRECRGPFLVICPTTVLSHWQQIINRFFPKLTSVCFHGSTRERIEDCTAFDVMLTSYGILRNDTSYLSSVPFAVTVFDEVHHCKNAQSQNFKAALQIQSPLKIGLTGTPIQNTLSELKALFDLVLPGYLGSDTLFEKQFIAPMAVVRNEDTVKQLRKMVSPFMLRRLKSTVLDELPPKIEDEMLCAMSSQQQTLYTDALHTRGAELLAMLKNESQPVPYVHVFSLLNLLKQICNHPALLYHDPFHFTNYSSGKWNVFTELLDECLEAQQKVVIFSQYLDMIAIIERFMQMRKTGYVTLTGSVRDRKSVIDTFNTDDACRVFIGSLKAGGVGIDLIGGSVVIHYDRWWNAAVEDQATDRVYRIGQKRGVQVFKLITEQTIEEKIAKIILRKKELVDDTLIEDSPDSVKTFTREELISLLEQTLE